MCNRWFSNAHVDSSLIVRVRNQFLIAFLKCFWSVKKYADIKTNIKENRYLSFANFTRKRQLIENLLLVELRSFEVFLFVSSFYTSLDFTYIIVNFFFLLDIVSGVLNISITNKFLCSIIAVVWLNFGVKRASNTIQAITHQYNGFDTATAKHQISKSFVHGYTRKR